MKIKIALLAAFIGLSLIILVSWSTSNGSEPDYRVVAPNGESIAATLSDLQSVVSSSVNAKFKTQQEFTITGINFLHNKFPGGVIANVDYKTAGGLSSNVVLLKNIPPANIFSKDKALDITNAGNKAIKVTCTGDPCCQVHAHIGNDGNIYVDCSCDSDSCSMLVEN